MARAGRSLAAMRPSRSRVLVAALVLLALLPATAGQAVPDDLTQQLDRARAELAELDTQVSLAVEDVNAVAAQLDRLQSQQQQTAARVDALRSEVAALEELTAAFVRQMYMRGPTTDLSIALASSEVGEAGRDLAVMDRLSRQRHAELEQLGTSRTELDAARTELADQVDAATTREAELAQRRDRVEAMLADQRDEVAALLARVEEIEAREAAAAAAAERRRQQAADRAAREAAPPQDDDAPEPPAPATAPAPAPSAPAPQAEPPAEPAPAPPGTRQGADTAVQAALSQLGKPYEYAAEGPDSYDCSGLTLWAWRHAGVSLPHSSRMQYAATTRVSRDQLQAGDLVFYGSPIHHVAMYLDGTRVVEAPYTGANVRIREDGLLRSDIVGYGRP